MSIEDETSNSMAPRLHRAVVIPAKDASWLAGGSIVFGVAINGDVRAYPKRIQAWHEMFEDRIGGRDLAGVYCTLCGALVLTLDTGHHRDYAEGAAYRSYLASDKLMFGVPKLDNRLQNKAEVLALRLAEVPDETLVIAADFLAGRAVFSARLGSVDLVELTDASGANRVYESAAVKLASWDRTARDEHGTVWQIEEARLTGPNGRTLDRLAAHRAFWFGWHAAFPETRLIE